MNAVGSGKQPDLREFINPEIIYSSDETEDGREGCFSTSKVCGIVDRAKKVTVRAYSREGKRLNINLRVSQPELLNTR